MAARAKRRVTQSIDSRIEETIRELRIVVRRRDDEKKTITKLLNRLSALYCELLCHCDDRSPRPMNQWGMGS